MVPRLSYRATCTTVRSTAKVVDLGALWAAPLCAQLLQEMGSRVIKVESSARPDGARAGPSHFFDLMNAGKESVALDLRTATGRSALNDLLIAADIVIESSRPRALEQMGIFAARILGTRRARFGSAFPAMDGGHRCGIGPPLVTMPAWPRGCPGW